MFRFTIYSIVAYAFWLTFVDVSNYLGAEEDGWLSTIKSEWANFKDDEPALNTTYLSSQDNDCQATNSCYEASAPLGE
ncbi:MULTISPECIES: hypothetical protein [Shewanella]|uniref:Uncharacterized protein n=1 Tax=Shewanella insulae TaxID=2681496 RepID=A0A6L7HSE9_9GAMM|nr:MULTISPECIES: hypothetical protein [Shewanella]KIO35106.1 hypothetical protein DB48_17705 [Shewanella sp. cp20]MCG9723254.1 hypothetical protein [Shewanella sp. Isolate7]MCG9746270.1 hypothetical protein [Shewanella sp. Isolate8]MXR67137.1 hypothetical protein [Shewanella insulae]